MEKKNLGVIQIILGGLLLMGLFIFSSYISPIFFDDSKIPFSWGAIILILMGIQNVSQSKFWQSNITKIVIIALTVIGLVNSVRYLTLPLFFIALLFQQIYTITPFIKPKTLGWIELTAFILTCVVSITGIVLLVTCFDVCPVGFINGRVSSFFSMDGSLVILSTLIFSITLLINAIFNFKKE